MTTILFNSSVAQIKKLLEKYRSSKNGSVYMCRNLEFNQAWETQVYKDFCTFFADKTYEHVLYDRDNAAGVAVINEAWNRRYAYRIAFLENILPLYELQEQMICRKIEASRDAALRKEGE
jgi:hypothetical protein